jgi:hypothetical protein
MQTAAWDKMAFHFIGMINHGLHRDLSSALRLKHKLSVREARARA